MNIVNKLTLCHLRENKGRTIITTLGICVSVAMITAVFVAAASFLNLFGNITLLSTGNQHAEFYAVNQEQIKKLKNDKDFSEIGLQLEEENSYYSLENAKSRAWGTGSIYTGDAVNIKQMITGEYDGTIPQNHNEIAIEKELIEKNELNWKVGDTVSVPVGTLIRDDIDGMEVQVNGTEQYKITAILHKNPATHTPIIKCCGNEFLTGNENLNAYCTLETVNMHSLDLLKSKIKEYKIENYTLNSDYLNTKFAADEGGTLMTSLVPFAAIVLVIIIIASVVLIYNSFGMSLSERVRYLGMLASVGATRKQKKMSVYFEGFILGAISIPVGIVAGVIGIGITLKALGDKIISTSMFSGINESNIDMEISVPVWAIIGIIVFSIFTIFISSFIPSRKASKITPIDAIRQREEIKIKTKKLRSPKIVKAVFGYEGELAYKNLKRNGRKSRVITASIALSLILFLSCNYFCTAFTQSVVLEASMPYQIQAMVRYEDKDAIGEKLKAMTNVDDFYCINYNMFYLENSDGANTEEDGYCKDLMDVKHLTRTYQNLFSKRVTVYVNIIDDDRFNQLCEKNNLDYHDYYTDGVKGVIMNNISRKEDSTKVFNDSVIGINAGETANSVKLSGIIDYDKDDHICNLNPVNTISIYTPYTPYYTAVYSNPEYLEESQTDFDSLMNSGHYIIGIETDAHEAVKGELENVLAEMDYSGTYISDFVEACQTMNTLAFILQVFVYGFIVLITMITIANIINTISTGIAMRRKEFAMLKSVGTTPKGFRKMVSLESVFYGLKALLFGLPISVLASYAMNKALGDNTLPFEINWILYLAVILVVFAITGLTMLYSVSKLKHDSIVETLKEDIV